MPKKKKIKAGILKRRESKKNRKQLQKKQNFQNKPKSNPSLKKVRHALSKIALYIFTPEIEAIKESKETIAAIYNKNIELPQQILEFATPIITEKFIEAIQKLLEKIDQTKNPTDFLALQSILHFMTEENGDPFLNQLIVAKYYQLLAEFGFSEMAVTKDNVLEIIQTYEMQFSGKFQEYSQQPLDENIDPTQSATDDIEDVEYSEVSSSDSEIAKLHEQVIKEIHTIKPDNLELVLEDIQLFFEDFCSQKNITEKSKIQPNIFKRFFNYVNQNLNPTPEDLINIKKSISHLAQALQNLNFFDTSQVTEILKLVEKS